MTDLQMSGTIESALSHLACVGLAAIIEDRTGVRPRIWWTEEWPSHPVMRAPIDHDQIFDAVRGHALAHIETTSWMGARVSGGPRDGNAVFTPRAPALATPDQWREYLAQRRAALYALTTSQRGGPTAADFRRLDAAMLIALGESAWWLYEAKTRLPDDGASRWEMKTRNRGEEFIRDRLAHLARAVAKRSIEHVGAGIRGAEVVDEVGRNAAHSRTSTGLTTPGPTDNALAWCALWGIAHAPTIPRRAQDGKSRGMSQSPGVWPRDTTHPRRYVLPIFTAPVTAARWRAVLVSSAFDDIVRGSSDGTEGAASRRWLVEQGVRAVAVFPSRVVGSASAPERQLLTGEVDPL